MNMSVKEQEKDVLVKPFQKVAKLLENGGLVSCVVCGEEEQNTLQRLPERSYNFLTQTGTICALTSSVTNSICSPCLSSVTTMEQACRIQSALAEKFRKRHLLGKNGAKTAATTAKLLKPGNAVNKPKMMVAASDSNDGLHLSIRDVRGGLEQHCMLGNGDVGAEASESSHRTVATDTLGLPDEALRLECEVFDHAAEVEAILSEVSCGEEILKPPPVPSDVSDAISRWLPSIGTSERSFESDITDTTQSSGSKESREVKSRSGWKCPMCEMTFESSPALVDHVHTVHSGMKDGESMACPFCKKQFPTYTQLDDHITQLHGDGSHSCSGCYSVYLRPTLLRKHQQYCREYKQYQEDQRAALWEETDDQPGEHTCGQCPISFSTDELLSTHMLSCQPNRKYACVGCKTGFGLLKELHDHETECSVFSTLKNARNSSQFSVLFSCQACKTKIDNYNEFQDHKRTCPSIKALLESESRDLSVKAPPMKSFGEEDVADQPTSGSPNANTSKRLGTETASNQGLTCSACLIVCSSETQLKAHFSAVHVNAEGCPFKCAGCHGGFASKEALDDHSSRCKRVCSTTVESYLCSECLISFQFPSCRELHMTIHRKCEDKPFRCAGCQAGFAALTHKVTHEKKCGRLQMSIDNCTLMETESKSDGSLLSVKSEPMETSAVDEVHKTFLCKVCFSTFAFYCDLQVHRGTCFWKESIDNVKCEEGYESSTAVNTTVNDGDSPSATCTDSQCSKCGIIFTGPTKKGIRSKLARHMLGHLDGEGTRRYSCPGCGWGTNSIRVTIVGHTKACRPLAVKFPSIKFDETRVRCPICFIMFGSIIECKNHFIAHHIWTLKNDADIFLCTGCHAHHSSKEDLSSHERDCLLFQRSRVVVGTGMSCAVCAATFITSYDSHFSELHTVRALNVLQCIICNEIFTEFDRLVVHFNTVCRLARSMLGTNSKCPPLAAATKALEQVDDGNGDLSDMESVVSDASYKEPCDICGCKRRTAKHMLIHLEGESKRFKCQGCNGGFSNIARQHRHEKICIRMKSRKVKVLPAKEPEVDPPLADLPTNFEVDAGLNLEQVAVTCSNCDETLPIDTKPEDHIVSCPALPKLKCGMCEKVFQYEESLLEHKQYCGTKATAAEAILSSPTRQKSNSDDEEVEEWKCLSCCVKFTDETSFLLHIASHEVSNVNKCSLCQTPFKLAADICMHMVKYHKLYLTTGLRRQDDDTIDDSDKDDDSNDSDIVGSPKGGVVNGADKSPKTKVTPKSPLRKAAVLDSDVDGVAIHSSAFKYELLTGTKCLVCKRSFKTNAILRRHYGIHDGWYSSVCLVCGIGFAKAKALRLHQSKVHKAARASDLSCGRCAGTFEQKYRLTKHEELCICSRNDAVIQCLLCTRTFDTWHQLKSHIWTHLSKCSFCEDKLPVYAKRVEHMFCCTNNPLNSVRHSQVLRARTKAQSSTEVALPETPLLAPLFPKLVAKGKKADKKKYKCKECCSAYATMKSLKRHEAVHEMAEYRCRVCGGKFSSLLAKNRHFLREHQANNTKIKAAIKSEPVSEERPVEPEIQTYFACNLCHKCFRFKEEKETHMREVHTTPVKAFNCKLCDKRFPSKFARRRHMQKMHSGPAAQPASLSCHICSKRFPSNFAKLQHLKKFHQLEKCDLEPLLAKKQRVCKVCGDTFDHKSELRAHKKTAHPQLANGGADNSIDLAPHMLLLGESKPDSKTRLCKVCSMEFEHKSELKAHYKSSHGSRLSDMPVTIDVIQPDMFSAKDSLAPPVMTDGIVTNVQTGEKHKLRPCKDCDKTFDKKADLKAHRKSEHKEKKGDATTVLTVTGETLQMLEGRKPARSLIDLTGDTEDDGPMPKRLKADVVTSDPSMLMQNGTQAAAATSTLAFKCEHCPKAFKLRISLNQHHTRAHPWIP